MNISTLNSLNSNSQSDALNLNCFELGNQFKSNSSKQRTLWTEEESEALLKVVDDIINEKCKINWTIVADRLNKLLTEKGLITSVKTGKQCRERWKNLLNPISKKNPWLKEEEEVLFRLNKSLGNKWTEIALYFKNRSDNDVKNHYYVSLRKRINYLRKELIVDGYIGNKLLLDVNGIYQLIKHTVTFVDLTKERLALELNLSFEQRRERMNRYNDQELLSFNACKFSILSKQKNTLSMALKLDELLFSHSSTTTDSNNRTFLSAKRPPSSRNDQMNILGRFEVFCNAMSAMSQKISDINKENLNK
jgi:hypothetical protein